MARKPRAPPPILLLLFPRRMACSHCVTEEIATSLEDMAEKLEMGGTCFSCRRWICAACFGRPVLKDGRAPLLN
jgi:hypothetical protein